MLLVKGIIESIQFTVSLMLFMYNCFLDWLKHISAFVTKLRFVKIVIS